MNHKILGRTNLKVSAVGLGGEHLEGKPQATIDAVVGLALDGGVNIMDVFMPGAAIRSGLAAAMGSRGRDMILQGHIGAVVENGQYARSRDPAVCDIFVKDFLNRFNRESIDIGMMHFIDTDADFETAFNSPYIDYVQSLKKQGMIRFIGASSHRPEVALRMAETGLVDVLMFATNPAFDMMPPNTGVGDLCQDEQFKEARMGMDPSRAKLYARCAELGVGITAMKALASGRLLSAATSPFGVGLTAVQCIAYALDRPAMASVLLGANSLEQMQACLAYNAATEADKDYTALGCGKHFSLRGACMYCNHCLPCPAGIDIAAVHRLLDMQIAHTNKQPTLHAHYHGLSNPASACLACGACEKRCPFGVPVQVNMKQAAGVFESAPK